MAVLWTLATSPTALWTLALLLLAPVLSAIRRRVHGQKYDIVNPSPAWDIFNFTSVSDFNQHGHERVAEGFSKFSGKPFILNTDVKPKLILSPEYIDTVNASLSLDFLQFCRDEFLSHLLSFRIFDAPGHLVEDMIRQKLTQNLAKFTVPISEEATIALDSLWGSSSDWQERTLKPDILTLISRLSAIIFTGGELAHNEEWQRITIDVTTNVFLGIKECRSFPKALQYIIQYFKPHATAVRHNMQKGRELMGEVMRRRRERTLEAKRNGVPAPEYNDAIAWIDELHASGRYPECDPTVVQLSLAMAAIHTSSDLLTQTLYHLCVMPETVDSLRKEAARVIGEKGWTKQALSELRLLDSMVKETQRIQSGGGLVMNRTALADVTLPNNVVIHKGQQMAVSSNLMLDPTIYENPQQLDPHRFFRRREDPKLAGKSHLVSTSIDHTGFSHGKHACPGRFFAANEIKIALVHILLKYDLELVDQREMPAPIAFGTFRSVNAAAKVRFRRRQEELSL